jgi:hypothetical protein
MTAGSLGDYLKRHAGMAYASWNNIVSDSSNSNNEEENIFNDNIQWEEPIIFRFNGKQYNVLVYYDRYSGLAPEAIIKYAGKSDAIDYTEIELELSYKVVQI